MHTYANFHWKCYAHIVCPGLGSAAATACWSSGRSILSAGSTCRAWRCCSPAAPSTCSNFDPVAALSRIESEKLTGAWLAPVMLNAIMGSGPAQDFDLSSLEWCIGGGERTPETRIRDFASVFPAARYIDAYGLTETTPATR